jgi:hypothetical protein
MPIIGLTDRGLSFPEIGQIRKGIKEDRKREDGSTYQVPVDLDYFRVEFDEKEVETADRFKAKYGEQPQEINIILPFDEIERCWDAWLEAYTAGRMVARSDGAKFTYWVDTDTGLPKVKNGEPFTPYKPGQVVGKDYQGKAVFANPVGRLKIIVPELGRAAFLTVHTTSFHDIANISMQLEAFKQINGGVIKGIPLVLRRRPKKISIPKDDGQRVRMQKWLLSIEADPAWVRAKLAEVKTLALPDGQALILEPGDDDPDLIEAVLPDIWSEDNEVEQIPKMDLETAKQVKSSQGVPYGEIAMEQLRHMWGALQAKISQARASREVADAVDLDELEYKRDAINVLMMADQEQEPEQES